MDIRTLSHNPYVILFVILLLGIYAIIAKKKNIRAIPVVLFIFYLITKLIMAFNIFGEKHAHILELISTLILGYAIIKLVITLLEWVFSKSFSLSRITRDALTVFLFIVWSFIILRFQSNINPISFLTTSAVLTAVVGFSLQNTLGNLFAGLALQMERPYKIGDWIECEGSTGQIMEIGWKSTRILTKEQELVIIPNLNVTKSVVKNLSKPDNTHIAHFDVGIDYDVSPDDVISTIKHSILSIDEIQKNPEPKIWLTEFSDFAIIYTVRFAHKMFRIERDILSEARRRIWYALKRKGFRIPFPIRDVRPWAEMREEEALERKKLSKKCNQAIRLAEIFKSLSDEEKNQLSELSVMKIYTTDEDIVRQANPGSSMFILSKGECSVILEGKIIANLKSGDYFGEMSLLTGEKRTATVRAKSTVEAVEIEKNAIEPILKNHPTISEELAIALASRQTELDKEKSEKDISSNASKIVAKIKSFFCL